MKRYLLIAFGIIAFMSTATAQNKYVEKPRLDYYKQQITIYTDSNFTQKKLISTDFQKFKLFAWTGKGWKALRWGLSTQGVDTVYIKDGQFVRTPEYRTVLESYDPKFKQLHRQYYYGLIKAHGKRIAAGIYNEQPVIGMTLRQFYMCMDRPDDINRTETAQGTSEQLVYNSGGYGTEYYYFTNGKLTAIQD